MTEDDAKKKWCPMARVRVFTGTTGPVAGANRNLPERDAGKENCIGSRCMAWREAKTGDGYCGLAGKH